MRIRIKSEGHNLVFALPTRLIFSKTAVRFANTVGRRYADTAMKDIPPQALELLCCELRRIKSAHGKWELVDIESANGDIVKIIL